MEPMQSQAAPVSSPAIFSGQLRLERSWSDWSAEKSPNDPSSWIHGPENGFAASSPWSQGSMHARNSPGLPAFPRARLDTLHDDSSLFSTSLPDLFRAKVKLSAEESSHNNINSNRRRSKEDEELESRALGSLLPDEEELFAGLADAYESSKGFDDAEDVDLFSSGGGMELDFQESFGGGAGGFLNGHSNGTLQPDQPNNNGAPVPGEHPYGEHPSRTLFVRNINSNVEDSELRSLFEQYGDIRTLYTACKHRGFVMISYFDIRSARSAMRALQGRPLRRRKLDIHFSIPKDNPSDKDVNQGTLVVFNLDASVSNDDLRQIFGAFGEVKEIRETPNKRHHKFVEFYDVRAAEAALRGLNRSDIAGKRIKLEPSRPGGTRRSSLLQQVTYENEDSSSPPGHLSQWNGFSQQMENGTGGFLNKPSTPPVRSHGAGSYGGKLHPQFLAHCHSLPENGVEAPNAFNSGFKSDAIETSHLKRTSSEAPYGSIGSAVRTSNTSTTSEQFLWGTSNSQSSSQWPGSYTHHHSGSPLYSTVLSGHHHHRPPHHHHQNHLVSSPPSAELPIHLPEALEMARGSLNGDAGFGLFSPHYRPPPHHQMFSSSVMNHSEFGRARRVESAIHQLENKRLFQLDLERILGGEDTRTTLMIKNIPNKYTSKMLLAAIDEHHRGTYDFIYLPIDFKNKCNVGYAFINMISPLSIVPFYQAFQGKKWEKFNSEKVASLAYARIQGKAALIAHFQNSSLMNEDKRCRPILFHSGGPNVGDQEPFPVSVRIRSSSSGGSPSSGSPKDELVN